MIRAVRRSGAPSGEARWLGSDSVVVFKFHFKKCVRFKKCGKNVIFSRCYWSFWVEVVETIKLSLSQNEGFGLFGYD